MIHNLKTWTEHFEKVMSGVKTFELRKYDREFSVHDILLLEEYDPTEQRYTGRTAERRVSHILTNCEHFGLKDGYCIMSLSNVMI